MAKRMSIEELRKDIARRKANVARLKASNERTRVDIMRLNNLRWKARNGKSTTSVRSGKGPSGGRNG